MSGRRAQQRASAAATYEQPDDDVLQVLSRELAGGARPLSRQNSILVHADELVRELPSMMSLAPTHVSGSRLIDTSGASDCHGTY